MWLASALLVDGCDGLGTTDDCLWVTNNSMSSDLFLNKNDEELRVCR